MRYQPQAKRSTWSKYQNDPNGFARDVLGVKLYEIQEKINVSVRDRKKTAVVSCHASGKTFDNAMLALWNTYAFSDSIALTTAPTFRQVKENTWGEIDRVFQTMPVKLEYQSYSPSLCRLTLGPKWQALGFSTDRLESAAGFHAERMLIIIDEASGVQEKVFTGLLGALAAGDVRMLLTSQGTQATGTFHRAFHGDRDQWSPIPISAFDTPNFQPDVVQAWKDANEPEFFKWPFPFLINPQFEKELRLSLGPGYEQDDLYRVKVLGQFVSGDPSSLINMWMIENAKKADCLPKPDDRIVLGLDVAAGGDDDSFWWIRKGPKVIGQGQRHGNDEMAVAEDVFNAALEVGAWAINVDEIGVGVGVRDRLRQIARQRKPNLLIRGINVGKPPRDTEEFQSFGAEAWWGLRDRFSDGQIDLSWAYENRRKAYERLYQELLAYRWKSMPTGRRAMEKKAEVKKRIGRSPDAGDALMLTFATPIPPEGPDVFIPGTGVKSNWISGS